MIYNQLGTRIFQKKRALGLKFNMYSHTVLERIIKETVSKHCQGESEDPEKDPEIDPDEIEGLENEPLFDENNRLRRVEGILGFDQCRV